MRGGCFCNPGAAEGAFGLDPALARQCYGDEFTIAKFRSCMGDTAVGALRASVGIATERRDIERLCEVIAAV